MASPSVVLKRRISPKQRILQTQLLYRTLKETIRKLSIGKLYSLQPHYSYINRANVSQASRGFVSDSWPFLFHFSCSLVLLKFAIKLQIYRRAHELDFGVDFFRLTVLNIDACLVIVIGLYAKKG